MIVKLKELCSPSRQATPCEKLPDRVKHVTGTEYFTRMLPLLSNNNVKTSVVNMTNYTNTHMLPPPAGTNHYNVIPTKFTDSGTLFAELVH